MNGGGEAVCMRLRRGQEQEKQLTCSVSCTMTERERRRGTLVMKCCVTASAFSAKQRPQIVTSLSSGANPNSHKAE